MDEFKARFGKANWLGVDHIPSGFSWGFTIETLENGRLDVLGPAIFSSGSAFPDDRLTEAACDFARATAEDARLDGRTRPGVSWVRKGPAGPLGHARDPAHGFRAAHRVHGAP